MERRGRTANKEPQKELEANESVIDELIKENQRLRMEVTYLKKLNALVQKKNSLQTTTKLM